MRKFLLASVATLGTGGRLAGPRARWRSYRHQHRYQGRSAHQPRGSRPIRRLRRRRPMSTTTTTTRLRPCRARWPTRRPGTIVVHFNGKVQVDAWGLWISAIDNHLADRDGRSPASATGPRCPHRLRSARHPRQQRHRRGEAATAGRSPASLACMPAADGMATNGLRYGAAIEIRAELHRPDQQQRQHGRIRLLLAGDAVCAACLHLRRR